MVDLDKSIDIVSVTPNTRVALRNDSYVLHKILPNKVDPLVSLMKVEKVPDSTYEMIGGLDKQIREIKEVRVHSNNLSRLLNCLSSIPRSLKVLVLLNPRECFSMVLQEQERRCSLVL